jgi:transposase
MKNAPQEYKPYPSDVSDEEWTFVVPYLTLCRLDAEQREHDLRAVFNALRWIVRSGAPWRMMPHEFPPWEAVYQQMRRWLKAGCFEALVNDLRVLLRAYVGRNAQPSAMVLDSRRTLQSTPESGARAGYDGAKRRKGSKVHAAVDTLGQLLALHVTPANEQDREQVEQLARQVQEITVKRWNWHMWTRAIPGRRLKRARRSMASDWKWSNTPKRSAASCCCHAGGLWNAASPGPPASDAWRATTNGWPKRLLAFTTSPLRA